MTTASYSTRVRHDSDATFREWGLEMSTQLATVGLVQTSDTGQINWVTVNRPASNTEAGYEIWRFDDALQGTAPIFFRIGYGTASSTTAPRMEIRVGTSSNGSGTIGGTALTALNFINGNSSQTTDTARQTYMCCVDGFFGVNWKVGASSSEGGFFIARTVDSAGAPTVTGAMVHWSSGGSTIITARQALRFAATAAAYTEKTTPAEAQLGFFAQNNGVSVVGSDLQTALAFTWTPRMEPLIGVVGVYDSEVTTGNTFTATMVGATPRTYIGLSALFGPFSAINSGTIPKCAMLWE